MLSHHEAKGLPKHWFWTYVYGKRHWGNGLQYAEDIVADIFSGFPLGKVKYKRASWYSVVLWLAGARYLWSSVRWWRSLNTNQKITIIGIAVAMLTALGVAWIQRCPCPDPPISN